MTLRVAGAVFSAFIFWAAPVIADPMDDALAAFEAQDFETAVGLWAPLANGGNG